MWESIINKVISLPFTETEDNGLTQKILDFSSEAKAFLQTGVTRRFELSIKSKMMDSWIAE